MRGPGVVESARSDRGARLDEREPELDLVEVPAAVVCATCGDPDCPGCATLDEPTHASGVVAVVPWERPGASALARLWQTARLATREHQAFFSALPEGDASAAFGFALGAELAAALGLALALVPGVLLIAPGLPTAALADAALAAQIARALILGVPGLALLMVALHAVHGLALDAGAKRQGARPHRARGLRFGLYACGWDLVTLPLGLVILAVADGPRAALRTLPLGMTVPRRAALAYLRGVHQLDSRQARAAARSAVWRTLAVVAAALALSTAALMGAALR
ncbi:MAG: hypothetical protein OZ921_07465 [Sorangiineae bacterium]|nr:hypothetical protein [Polyangiaceae bacterium]MEB2322335.1 hypothetical protein [Sorangiineae bacterium]